MDALQGVPAVVEVHPAETVDKWYRSATHLHDMDSCWMLYGSGACHILQLRNGWSGQ